MGVFDVVRLKVFFSEFFDLMKFAPIAFSMAGNDFYRVILNSSFILHSNFLISDNRFS